MSQKTILISIIAIVAVLLALAGYFLFWQSQKADEAAARAVVEKFGYTMKNFSLLSPTFKQDMEVNYKDFVSPDLLKEWGSNPSIAVGRITSSPWPDKIQITGIGLSGIGSYGISGNIILLTSSEVTSGQQTVVQPITLTVKKINGKWLIVSAKTGDFKIDKVP